MNTSLTPHYRKNNWHARSWLGMSVSGFYHHFKSVTAMSPLQFQKQIRLQEARRLMLGEDLDAAPQRDIVSLRSRLEA